MGVHGFTTAHYTRLESDVLTVEISTLGGAILSGRMRDGRRFLSGASTSSGARPADGTACFPMVPLCNRVEDNAFTFRSRAYRVRPNSGDPLYLHGDGWLAEWQLVHSDTDEAHLLFDKQASDDAPWAYRAEQTFRIEGAHLGVTLGVTNRGMEPMPFGLGFHPYFPRTPQMTLHAPARDWWTEREGCLPDERWPVAGPVDFSVPRLLPAMRLNNGFEGWSGTARIVWPETRLGVEITADALLGRYMIYAPDEARDFFCFEPMSHTPNALAHVDNDPQGMRTLDPGERLQVSMTVNVFEEEA